MEDCSYEIYINPKNGDLSKENFVKVAEINELDSNLAYTTVKLDKPVLLTGEKFAVGIRYNAQSGAYLPFESELNYSLNLYSTANSNKGESFACASENFDNWIDLKDDLIPGRDNLNICLKAYTTNANEVLGDLNNDNKVTGTDILKLKRHIVGIQELDVTIQNLADLNLDGNITGTDLLKMKKIVVGLN